MDFELLETYLRQLIDPVHLDLERSYSDFKIFFVQSDQLLHELEVTEDNIFVSRSWEKSAGIGPFLTINISDLHVPVTGSREYGVAQEIVRTIESIVGVSIGP